MTARLFHEPGIGLGFVDIVVAFSIGSEADPPGREGLAHLALRVLRAGAAEMTRAQVDAEVERLGAHLEAAAGLHRWSVRGRVIRENLEPFAGLLCDLVTRPAMREDDFDRAKRLLDAELVSLRDDDQALAGRAFRRALFADHPAGRPSSGTVASVRAISLDDCAAWCRSAPSLDRLVVGVAGDIDEAQAERLLLRPLRALPARSAIAAGPVAQPAPPRGRRAVLLDKPERTQAQIYAGHLGPRPGTPDHMGMLVSSVAFGGTFSARLMQEVRVKRGWSYGAYSRLSRGKTDDAFHLWTFPAARDAGPCLALELDMLRALARDGISDEELAFARGHVAGASVFLVDTPADRLERRIEIEMLGFPHDYYSALRRNVEAVTPERARTATRNHVHPDDLVVAMLCTAADVEKPVREALGDGASVEVKPFDADDL